MTTADPENPLSQLEWLVLNALADDMEPVEAISHDLCHNSGLTLSADQFLTVIFNLYCRGYLTVKQAPIPAFGQQFAERILDPSQPHEVVGDLDAPFRQAYATGDYLRHVMSAGVPFGIYCELTASGRGEWDNPRYESYWPADSK